MDATRGDPPSRPELSGDREDLPRGRRPVIQVALAARGDVYTWRSVRSPPFVFLGDPRPSR